MDHRWNCNDGHDDSAEARVQELFAPVVTRKFSRAAFTNNVTVTCAVLP